MTKMSMARGRRQSRFWNPTGYDYVYHPPVSVDNFIMVGLQRSQESLYVMRLNKTTLLPEWSTPMRTVSIYGAPPTDKSYPTNIELAYNTLAKKFYYVGGLYEGMEVQSQESSLLIGSIDSLGAYTTTDLPRLGINTDESPRHYGPVGVACAQGGKVIVPWMADRITGGNGYYDVYGIDPSDDFSAAASYDDVAYASNVEPDVLDPNVRAATDADGNTWVISDQEKGAVLRKITPAFSKGVPLAYVYPGISVPYTVSDMALCDIVVDNGGEFVYTGVIATILADPIVSGVVVSQYDVGGASLASGALNDDNDMAFLTGQRYGKCSLACDASNSIWAGMPAANVTQYNLGERTESSRYILAKILSDATSYPDDLIPVPNLTRYDSIDLACGYPNTFFGIPKTDAALQIQINAWVGGIRADTKGNVFVTGAFDTLQAQVEGVWQYQIQGNYTFVSRITNGVVKTVLFGDKSAESFPSGCTTGASIMFDLGEDMHAVGKDVSCIDELGRKNF